MRPYLYLILFLIVLVLPFVMRMAVVGREPSHKSANAEHLTIITPHNQDIRREFQRGFSAWHQKKYGTAVQIDYLVPGGTVDIKRQIQNIYDGYRDPVTHRLPADVSTGIDLVWGGGDVFFYIELQPLGVLQPAHLDPALLEAAFPEKALAGVKLLDLSHDATGRLTPQWIGTCLSGFGIVYNADLYQALGLPEPTTWPELGDPKLRGLVELADPAHSGSAAAAYMMVVQRAMADEEARFFDHNPSLRNAPPAELQKHAGYSAALAAGYNRGMGQLLLIAANTRYFTDQAPQVPNDVGNGQAAAGMAIDFLGRVYQESVGPRRCKVVLPAGATAITPDPIGILYGVKGRQLQLATHFVEYLISPEGQLMWILEPGRPNGPAERSLRRSLIRRDVYANRTGWADDTDPFVQARGFNQRGDWMAALFSDTRSIWAAAWIDVREDLMRAHSRICAMPDSPRRRQLLADLADLPLTMQDVDTMRIERKQREKSGTAEEWKAVQRIEWDRRFQEHYRQVLRKAQAPG